MTLLTRKRANYAAQRRSVVTFNGTTLKYNAAVSERYVKRLNALTAQMTAQVKRDLLRYFRTPKVKEYFAQDGSVASQARILVNSLTQKFDELFARHAKATATSMVKEAAAASKTQLHGSLQKMSGGLSLKTSVMDTPQLLNIYKASVASNVALIKSIPSQYMQQVQGAVMRSITTGNGLQDLVPALEQYEGITHRRATNIALDQTRKAYNSINKGRMQDIGVEKFMWHHSGGGAHPREDHIQMDGNIYSFNDLPVIDENTGEKGIPGQAVNCRCTMSPIFEA